MTNPILIPLVYTQIGSGNYKYGIELTIGNSTTPGLFEFDTGGTGFYAAYATNTASPWWGSDVPTNSATVATNYYDSGLTYLGTAVTSRVSFWSNSMSMVSATDVSIGQTTNIFEGSTNYWTPAGPATNTPPINGAFQGDFGMSLAYASNTVANIVAQMSFGNGITPGFLVNTPLNGIGGFLQIGLTAAQTNAATFNYFKMNSGSGTYANSGLPYYSEQLFNATMTLSNGSTVYSTTLGITPDTGATPALHNTTNDPSFPSNSLSAQVGTNKFALTNGTSFSLTATNSNGSNSLLDFTTVQLASENDYAASNAQVTIQNNGSNSTYTNYYYNAGLYFFNQHQVIYDLQNGNIGLSQSVPEPSTLWLLLLGLSVLSLLRLRKRSADRF